MPSTQPAFIMTVPTDLGVVPFTDVIIPSDTSEARRLQEEIEQQIAVLKVSEQEVFSVRLALEEALVNAIKHGNQMDRSKKVRVAYRFLLDRLEIHITDEGTGFDPEDVPDPTAVENLERPCGRGLMLMRHYMTEVVYHAPGNRLTMSKIRKPVANGCR